MRAAGQPALGLAGCRMPAPPGRPHALTLSPPPDLAPSDRPLQTILPGDVLVTTCAYDSRGRANTTHYGYPSSSEMCFSFIQVGWPGPGPGWPAAGPQWAAGRLIDVAGRPGCLARGLLDRLRLIALTAGRLACA
jgi:hypothetical protein